MSAFKTRNIGVTIHAINDVFGLAFYPIKAWPPSIAMLWPFT